MGKKVITAFVSQAGCKVERAFVKAEECTAEVGGGFSPDGHGVRGSTVTNMHHVQKPYCNIDTLHLY